MPTPRPTTLPAHPAAPATHPVEVESPPLSDLDAMDDNIRQRSILLDDPLDAPTPPVRRGRNRVVLLIAAGIIMMITLAAVVLNMDRGLGGEGRTQRPTAFDNTPAPAPGVDDAAPMREFSNSPNAIHTERGWIQATENGRLSQEYRYARSEPASGGRLRLTLPEVKVYMKDARVLTLRGESAVVHAPNKALESGTMTGAVLIRLYEVPGGLRLDTQSHEPVLEVRTEEASFDNFQGEIVCPGIVDIQTKTAHVPAAGVRLQINDFEGRPGDLRFERLTGNIRLSEAARDQSERDRDLPTGDASREPAAQPAEAVARSAETTAPQVPSRNRPRERDSVASNREQRQQDRMRDRREGRLPAPQPIARKDGPYFYRLTLNQNVRIRQGDGTRGWTASGDQMHIIFSLDSSDLDQSLSHHRHQSQPELIGPAEPMPLHTAIIAMAVAAVEDEPNTGLFKPADSDTIISCDGPLAMVPLVNIAEQPASAEDSRFELVGAPVVLHNIDDATHITCDSLRYASQSQMLELIGKTQNALVIDSPELHAEGERFWIDRINARGGFEGPGWMSAGERQNDRAATQPALPGSDAERDDDVRIAWQDGVDLEFQQIAQAPTESDAPTLADDRSTPHDSFGRLSRATFTGTVAVKSPDFTLDAQMMAVGFPKRDDAAVDSQQRLASIEFIHAEQDVVAGSMSDGGSIHCDDLRIAFASHEGKTIPVSMLAQGGVAAIDRDRQTVWADQLNVAFKPVGEGENASFEHTALAATEAQKDDRIQRRANVETFTATGGVQVRLAEGGRAFADRLESDGEGHRVVLSGSDVMVASERTIIHHGSRLELTNKGQQVLWPGAGEFAYYAQPVLDAAVTDRLGRPTVDTHTNPQQMLARWTESMVYDDTVADGAGSILIRGNVNAQSSPTAFELNTTTSEQLTILFAKAEMEPASQPEMIGPVPALQPDDMLAMNQRGRKLRQLFAEGGAKLESRTWMNADHSDKPRVFYLSSEHIVYDDETLEATVPGGGELLVRDERIVVASTQPQMGPPAPAATPTPQARRANLPFGAKGTTFFRWTESLRMIRRQGSTYDIVMVGGIEVRHRALDQTLSTMTGELLEATVNRTASASQRDAGFDLGGSMDLRRIRAAGAVFVDSPTRDVDCDEFDYDYATGLAKLLATGDRVVTVMSANNPHSVQARSFIWNIIDDTVTASRISGSSGR